ncbi:hypothetical protein GCM10022222_02840 [Amycolatopsis ultiminotia]|uniref:Uncharacterized protein n=1 Tax=Amycolatopsis ultiminotia TaxID=543629 RepID=A0ABP6UXB9_9PSEU
MRPDSRLNPSNPAPARQRPHRHRRSAPADRGLNCDDRRQAGRAPQLSGGPSSGRGRHRHRLRSPGIVAAARAAVAGAGRRCGSNPTQYRPNPPECPHRTYPPGRVWFSRACVR